MNFFNKFAKVGLILEEVCMGKAQFLLFVRFRGQLLQATETQLNSSPVSPMWSECDFKGAVSRTSF